MGNEELAELKTLYDDLWRDARTMIKDLNRNITMIFLFGVTLLALAPIEFGTAVEMYAKIAAAGFTWTVNYIYLAASSLGVVISIPAGVLMLRYFFQLKNRYAKVIELERALGD